PLWRSRLLGKRLDLVGEFGISYWHSTQRDGRDAVQLSATPMFQWWLGEHCYIEAGIGAALFSRSRVGGRRLGTLLQIEVQLGVDHQVSESLRLNLRATQYANGGVASSNDVVNIYQLGLTMRW